MIRVSFQRNYFYNGSPLDASPLLRFRSSRLPSICPGVQVVLPIGGPMNIFLVPLMMTLLAMGCASHLTDRKIASLKKTQCYIKKHPTKYYYQIYHKNQLLFEHWYDEEYASQLLKRAIKKGQCD